MNTSFSVMGTASMRVVLAKSPLAKVMMPVQDASFLRVPNELQLQILYLSSSPDDLLKLVSTCRQFLALFSSNKRLVLSKVLENVLGPEVIFDAVYLGEALKAPRRSRLDTMVFVEEYLGNLVSRIHVESLDLSGVMELYKQHRVIEYHLEKMCKEVRKSTKQCMQALNATTFDPDPVVNLPQSTTETARLRRALYRIELLSALGCRRRDDNGNIANFHASTQAAIFLAKIPPWAVEEMAAVWQYLQSSLGECFDRIEDQFVRIAQESAHSASSEAIEIDRKVIAKDFKNSYAFSREPNFDGEQRLFQFQGKNQFFTVLGKRSGLHEETIAVMYAGGLVQIGKFFEADLQGQSRAALVAATIKPKYTFKNAYTIYKQQLEARVQDWPEYKDRTQGYEDLDKPNAGYRWLQRELSKKHSFPGRHQGGLRSLAYMFWSQERLEKSCLLGKPMKQIKEACQDETPGKRKWQPSAEFRVKQNMERIFKIAREKALDYFYE